MNKILFLSLILILNTNQKSDLNSEALLYVEEPENYEANDDKKQENLIKLVNEYIDKENWDQEKEINKDEFSKMFQYIIQKSALKQDNAGILARFAEKTMNEYGEPIFVKNLQQYFNLKNLRKIYLLLFNPEINTDL